MLEDAKVPVVFPKNEFYVLLNFGINSVPGDYNDSVALGVVLKSFLGEFGCITTTYFLFVFSYAF